MNKYFSYCPESGFDEHDTAEEAKAAADDAISYFRENAEEGWADEVDGVCWGIISEQATKVNEMTTEEAAEEGIYISSCCDGHCDYALNPIESSGLKS